jgi:hypothetical protein
MNFAFQVTQNLKKNNIKDICKLKNEVWKYNMKSQIKWFKKNIKKKDTHFLLFYENFLSGYLCLRENSYYRKKKIRYLIFDTLVIKKKYQNLGLAKIIMINFINFINKNRKNCFLFCDTSKISYYQKFGWKVLKKRKEISYIKNKSFNNTNKIIMYLKSPHSIKLYA